MQLSTHAHRPANTPAGAAGAATYVCPMDPEVRESKPGACPKCGMALEPEVPVAATKTEWTCPMHPEIVRDGPGSCPICGMALEPRTVTIDEPENPKLVDMRRRFAMVFASATSGRINQSAYTNGRLVTFFHCSPRSQKWNSQECLSRKRIA